MERSLSGAFRRFVALFNGVETFKKNDAELPLYRQFRILILIEKDSHRAVLMN